MSAVAGGTGDPSRSVIWHDLECGSYEADLPLWASLAERHAGPVLDVGAGTGRVALDLARRGVPVIALDRDPELLAALTRRAAAESLPVTTVCADAREFVLEQRVGLVLVPMQTVQLLDGEAGRARFLRCAGRALADGATIAIAIAATLEPFDVAAGFPAPLPDVGEIDGTVYSSLPLAVRPDATGYVLERRRETVTPTGELSSEPDVIHLDLVDPGQLEAEAEAAGLTVLPRLAVAETADYVGSVVVMLRG